jgi:hypothetical protein
MVEGRLMNVAGELVGDKLVLTIDTSEEARAKAQPSKTGKTLLLASTRSFVKFGDISVSLNALIERPQ